MTEPYVGTDTPMNRQPEKGQLSTADMAAAAGGPSPAQQDEAVRVKETQAVDKPQADRMDSMTPAGDGKTVTGKPAALLTPDEVGGLRSRWDDIQTHFVDEPRKSVEQADALVAEVMKRLAEVFAQERNQLEGQWGRGGQVSTEDLRVAMQRYRSFFDRLLSI
jgi:hypothetical protein